MWEVCGIVVCVYQYGMSLACIGRGSCQVHRFRIVVDFTSGLVTEPWGPLPSLGPRYTSDAAAAQTPPQPSSFKAASLRTSAAHA